MKENKQINIIYGRTWRIILTSSILSLSFSMFVSSLFYLNEVNLFTMLSSTSLAIFSIFLSLLFEINISFENKIKEMKKNKKELEEKQKIFKYEINLFLNGFKTMGYKNFKNSM